MSEADKPMARIFLGDATWHDGAGWYYVDDEYRDEGSCGAFATREECAKHAEDGGYDVVFHECAICKRPKYTKAHLARWKAELGDAIGPDPEWARQLCWTKPEFKCQCKPLEIAVA